MFSENIGLKIISLLMAVFIWVQSLLVSEHRTVVSLPVVLKNVPKNLTLERLPQSIPFNVRGNGLEIIKLKLSRTKVYVDAAKIKPGNDIISLADYTIDLPENIKLSLIGPVEKQNIAVQADVFHQKKVPVVLNFADTYTRQRFTNLSYQLVPNSVVVFGPKKKVQIIDQISTEPITRDMASERELTLRLGGLDSEVSVSDKQIKVRVSTSYSTTKIFDGIPIATPEGKSSYPTQVTIKLSGDSEVLKNLSIKFLSASIASETDAQGFHPVVVSAPPSVTVVAVTPNKVRLR